MRVAIIDYGSGNLRSAMKAFERAACETGVAAEIELTAEPERVLSADRIVLPGVGAYADCAAGLHGVAGLWEAVEEAAIARAEIHGLAARLALLERERADLGTRGDGSAAAARDDESPGPGDRRGLDGSTT